MENIIISDPEEFEKIKRYITNQGTGNLLIIGDFGRTFTKCFDNEGKVPTSFAQIREGGYLGEEYKKRALELFDKYHPIEINSDLSADEKVPKLIEWWKKHLELIVDSKLNREMISDIVKKGKVPLRERLSEFLDNLKDKNVPLVIVSQGLGDIYMESLKNINKLSNNIFFVTNLFNFDESGKAISVQDTIINSFNKDRINFKDYGFFGKIKDKKNVILLGDDLQDLGMVKNLDYDNLIKIGFLNENVDENLEKYKEGYDVVITGDGDFSFVNELIGEILK